MRLFLIKTLRLFLSFTLLATVIAVGQEPANTVLPAAPCDGQTVVAQAPWRVAGKHGRLLCQVSQQSGLGADRSPTRALDICRKEGPKFRRILNFETPDSLLNIYAIGDYNGRQFTTWIAGSAYHLRIWASVGGGVKQVLDQGTRVAPEVLYDDQGRESVLVSDPILANGKWTARKGTTKVFKWNGESYEQIGTVPWIKRLQCLSKGSCGSLK